MSFGLTRNPRGIQIPYAELTQAATGIANTGFYTPNLTSTSYDNGAASCGQALADLANDRIYLRRAGIWMLHGYAIWAANGAGTRYQGIRINGNEVSSNTTLPYSGLVPVANAVACPYYTTATTDYLDTLLWQNSGGTLNATVALRATWLGPY